MPIADLDFNTSVGCVFLGVLFAILLYGVTCAQVIYYAYYYQQDQRYMKCLVGILWLLDTASTTLDIYIIYPDVTAHAVLSRLFPVQVFRALAAEYLISTLMIIVVQCFYVHTIWKLSSKRSIRLPLTAVMLAFYLASCVLGIVTSYLMAHTSDVISSTEASYRTQSSTSVVHWYDEWPTTLQTIFASVADICITVFMCWYFMNNAREPVLKQTKSLLRTLTVYTINRGLLTTTLQILQAVTFTAYKEVVFYWLLFHFPGSKVYVNSLLALFNARRRLRRVSEPDSSLSLAQNVDSPV